MSSTLKGSIGSFKEKIGDVLKSKQMRVAIFFFFYFVMTSLVETIANFYEIKSTIIHGYSMWILIFLFLITILPAKASHLRTKDA